MIIIYHCVSVRQVNCNQWKYFVHVPNFVCVCCCCRLLLYSAILLCQPVECNSEWVTVTFYRMFSIINYSGAWVCVLYHYKTHCLEHSQQTCQSAFLFVVAVVVNCKYMNYDFYGLVFVLFSFINLFIFTVIVPAYVHFLCYRPCVFTFSVIGPVYVHFLSHWPSVCSLSQSLAQCMFTFSVIGQVYVHFFSVIGPVYVYFFSHWPSACSLSQLLICFLSFLIQCLFIDLAYVHFLSYWHSVCSPAYQPSVEVLKLLAGYISLQS